MSKSIFKIVNEYLDITSQLVETGGELTPEIESLLVINQAEFVTKIDSYASVLEQLRMAKDLWTKRKTRVGNVCKTIDAMTDRLKGNIIDSVKKLGVNKVDGKETAFRIKTTNGAVKFSDEKLIPEKYKIQTIVTTIDKAAIGDDLRSGIPVAGCYLQINDSLSEANPDIL